MKSIVCVCCKKNIESNENQQYICVKPQYNIENLCVDCVDTYDGEYVERMPKISNRMQSRILALLMLYSYDNCCMNEEDVLKCQEHFKDFKEYCQTCMKNYCENCEKCNHTKENIDKAINNNWIKAYYQPIIRTANQKVRILSK